MSYRQPAGAPAPQPFPHAAPVPVGVGGAPSSWGSAVPPRPVPRGLGVASVVLVAVVTAGAVLQAALSVPVVSTLHALVAGENVPTGVLSAYDAVAVLTGVIQVAAAVVSVVWLWQCRRFAEAASPGWPHARSRVWVWLGWILPVVSLWFPLQVVRDVRAATLRAQRPGLGTWWAAWLVGGFAANAGSRLMSSDSPDVWSALPVLDAVGAVAFVVAAVLWARTVREVSEGQRAAVPIVATPGSGWS